MSKGSKEKLAKTIADNSIIYNNSSSDKKAAGLLWVMNQTIGENCVKVEVLRSLTSQYTETDVPNSEYVAKQKSIHFQEKLGKEYVTAGADTVYRIRRNGKWENFSKLERIGRDLTGQELLKEYNDLYKDLCTPDGGVGEMMWDVSLAITNGGTETFNETIYIQHEPIDKEIFDFFFDDAIKTGMLYKSNARMSMIELLAASGAVKKMAFLGKGGELKRMIREPNKELLKLATLDIVTTMPTAYLVGLTEDNQNWRGHQAS